MPKRTNSFQAFVSLIEWQLTPLGATITESKLLRDRRSGLYREVDVVIECDVGQHAIVIGVEVIDHGRPASIEWVERMIAKHADLPTDKLVLVSKAGFRPNAQHKAEQHGVTALTFTQAMESDWQAVVPRPDQMPLVLLDLFAGPPQFVLGFIEPGPPSVVRSVPELILYQPDGSKLGTAADLVKRFLREVMATPQILDSLFNCATPDGDVPVDFTLRLPDGSYVLSEGEDKYPVVHIKIKATGRLMTQSIQFSSYIYGRTPIATGTTAMFGRDVPVTVVARPGAQPTIGFALRPALRAGELLTVIHSDES